MASKPRRPAPSLFDALPPEPARRPKAAQRAPAAKERTAAPAAEGSGPDAGEGAEGAERAERVFTVVELTREVRARLEGLGKVRVEGEISRVTRAASGHVYFDLKDAEAKISCTIWRSRLKAAAGFELAEGQQVVVHGKLDVYAPRGTYSLGVHRVERAGLGALLARLEALKAELRGKGWFDRARPVPANPRLVGVVTSRDGAAFQDFLRTRTLRWPAYPVRLCHTPVQGPGAAERIAAAIRALDASGVDVIVVCRGGGSLEDLWAFNELAVAEAVHAASAPVVSGVGHETDVTLCDLVADVRAHTPTDAAQTVLPDRRALVDRLERAHEWLSRAIDEVVGERAERLERLRRSRVLASPAWIVEGPALRLGQLARRLALGGARLPDVAGARLSDLGHRLRARSPQRLFEHRAARLAEAGHRLRSAARARLEAAERGVEVGAARLHALSPLAILGRGYSITTRDGGAEPLRRAEDLSEGDALRTRLAGGQVVSRVTAVEPDSSPNVDTPNGAPGRR